ncbi:hypothetical protein LAUMK22_05712 [Mycobacterium kansasii]|nr:hypothetical protein LAUMK22_05712 [Mycobacterium kansasii]
MATVAVTAARAVAPRCCLVLLVPGAPAVQVSTPALVAMAGPAGMVVPAGTVGFSAGAALVAPVAPVGPAGPARMAVLSGVLAEPEELAATAAPAGEVRSCSATADTVV